MYYDFNPSLPEPLKLIHPLQLSGVRQLLTNKFPDFIDSIFLFGSSLDVTCDVKSDLDLYVNTSDPDQETVYRYMHGICQVLPRPFDIIVSTEVDFKNEMVKIGTVESRILQKGVVLYAKDKRDTA